MASARLKIDWNGVNSSFRRLGKRARANALARIVEVAKQRAPVDTGALRDSIHATEMQVVAPVHYAWFQEFGTRFHPPQPYLGPALLQVADEIRNGRSWWRRLRDMF